MQIRNGVNMLFKSKRSERKAAEISAEIDDQLNERVDQDKVLDFIIELSDTDFEKLIKVAKVYREANRKAAEIMGAGESDKQPEASTPHPLDQAFDNDLDAAFEETEPTANVKVHIPVEVDDELRS